MQFRVVAFAALLALAMPAHAAQPGFGPWADGAQAEVRLVAAGIGEDGRLHGGIEIRLEPGWWTYWRTPGAAGIPPVIDFAGSDNLGRVDISYPLPVRHDDGYGATNVYPDGVLLPFSAEIPDPAAPVALRLAIDLGVCQDVCVPDHADVAFDVPVGLDARVAAATLAGAMSKVPGAPVPGVLAVDGARRAGGDDKHPVFDIAVTAPDNAIVFVEGPPDWYAGAPERLAGAPATYRVTVDRIGARTPLDEASLRVTLAAGGKAIEQTVPID